MPAAKVSYTLITPNGEEAKVSDLPRTYHRVGRSHPCRYHNLKDLIIVLSTRAGLSQRDWVKAFEAGVTLPGFQIHKRLTTFSPITQNLNDLCDSFPNEDETEDLDITKVETAKS